MLRASALVQLGREDEALGWLSGLECPANWSILGVLAAPAFRLEGEIHDRAGRRAEALRAYGTFLELWRNAGPEAQDQVSAVQARVAALSGDS